MNIIIRYILPEYRDFDLVLWDGWQFWLANGWFMRFQAQVSEVTVGHPCGLNYSLTLHDETGRRLMDFDHRHRYGMTREVTPYAFVDSFQLVADFMEAIEGICAREGIEFRFVGRKELPDEN